MESTYSKLVAAQPLPTPEEEYSHDASAIVIVPGIALGSTFHNRACPVSLFDQST